MEHGKWACQCECEYGYDGEVLKALSGERVCVVFVGEEGVEGEERESGKEGDDVEFVVPYDSSVCLGVCLL